MRTDIYQKITDRIVAALEHGVRPWRKPWNAGNGGGGIIVIPLIFTDEQRPASKLTDRPRTVCLLRAPRHGRELHRR
jgi:N-terminal domain of anti-restriction factor ArdC